MVKVYGPYKNREGRNIVIICSPQGNRTTQYARYLMEQKLGRLLLLTETVDHIDGNKTNDSIKNLQILSRGENIRKSVIPAPQYTFVCPVCNEVSSKSLSKVAGNWKQGKAGPFCSRSCAGKYPSVAQMVEAIGSNPMKC